MTRRRIAVLVVLLLLEVLVLGCFGWGTPTLVGTHRFQAPSGDDGVNVWDPPAFGAFLGGPPAEFLAGQFSPDGQWLYIEYTGGSTSLASISAHERDGVLRVALRVKSECLLACAAVGYYYGARVHLAPSIDPGSPPAVQVNGEPITLEPWLP